MSDRKEQLKEVAPHVWAMYTHVFEERRKLENKLNYFLAINTLFIFGFIQFFLKELAQLEFVYLIPFIFLLVPILVLLANFVSKAFRISWIEKEQLIKHLDKGQFSQEWLVDIYKCAYGSHEYQKRLVRVINFCLSSLSISLLWLLVLFLIKLNQTPIPIQEQAVILFLLLLGAIAVIYVLCKNSHKFPYKERELEIRKFLDGWLAGDGSEGKDTK